MRHQADIFKAMQQAAFYDHPVTGVEVRETHISKVFLAGDYAYKVKKSIRQAFLDFSTLSKRRYFCHRELTLNRRLSTRIYLGIVPLTFEKGRYCLSGPGRTVEYAIKMRRIPEERSMLRLLRQNKIDRAAIDSLARSLAEFYRSSRSGGARKSFATWEAIRTICEENFGEAEKFVGELIDQRTFQTIQAASRSFLKSRKALFDHRVAARKIRNGHGDLRSGHVYFDDGIQIIDCVEFNRRFSHLDVASDLAFLSMDLEVEGFPDVALELMEACARHLNDPGMFALLDFYKCYRAIVRAKVNGLRFEQKRLEGRGRKKLRKEIDRHVDIAMRCAIRFTRPTLWAVCGLPGSGKSTVARELAAALQIKVLQSDLIRKELFAVPLHTAAVEGFGEGLYSDGARAQVYGRLLRRAQEEIENGESVILDATFNIRHQRREALRLAENSQAKCIFIECQAPPELLASRLALRDPITSISDARPGHLEQLKRRFEPIVEIPEQRHIRIDTRESLSENLHQVLFRHFSDPYPGDSEHLA